LAIGAIAVGAGSASALHPLQGDLPGPQSHEEEMMQRLAETSCLCERRTGPSGKDACWAAFHRKMPQSDVGGTACAPVAQEERCGTVKGPAGDSNVCVIVDYDYIGDGPDRPAHLCTREEAMAAEAAWYDEAFARNKGRDWPVAGFSTPRTNQMVRDLLAGKPIDLTPKRGVCTSS
jgi:hypothetical protein